MSAHYLHHLILRAEANGFGLQCQQLVGVNCSVHIKVNLRQLFYLSPGSGGVTDEKGFHPFYLFELLPTLKAGVAINQLIEGGGQMVRLVAQLGAPPVGIVFAYSRAVEDKQVGDEVEDEGARPMRAA